MVERIIKNLRLSNMNCTPLRDSKCLFYMDENSGPNSIEDYKIKKEQRKNKILWGKNFYDLPFISKVNEEDYQKFNNLKESRLPQPYRDYENYINPISHFRTPGFDKDRHKTPESVKIEPIMEPTPTNSKPEDINSNRLNCPNIFEELNRGSEYDVTVLSHNSRNKSTDQCKATLRAAERLKIIKSLDDDVVSKPLSFISNAFPEFTAKNNSDATEQDLKALKYMYTTTTQKANEDVPFDSYLYPRRWAPVSTKERSADPLRATFKESRTYPSVDTWKNNTTDKLPEYERKQVRADHFLLKRPHDFCAPMKKADQIPTYSGEIGAYNKDDIDNPNVDDFKPFTTRRNLVPKFADCTERPVFVGYTGKIPHLPGNMNPPFHTDPTPRNVLGQPC